MSLQTAAFSRPIAAYSGQARSTRNSFEQSLADGQLRRVECKELLFAEGDSVPTCIASRPVPWPFIASCRMAGVRSWALPIRARSSAWVSKARTR